MTKIPKIDENLSFQNNFIEKKLKSSLINLKKNNIYALMFRNPTNYINKNKIRLWEEAKELQKTGLITKLGITIYDPIELEESFNILQPDLVQCPYNLFDRRIEYSSWLNKLFQKNVEIHTRSVFLQGLLLRKNNELPEKFLKYKKIWDNYHNWLQENNISALEACINFILENKEISKMVIGIENKEQFNEIIRVKEKKINFPSWKESIEEELIDPRKW